MQQARQSQQVQQAQPTAAGSGPGARTRRTDPGANANLRLPVQRSLLLARPWLDELSGVEQAAVGGLRWLTLDMGAQGQLQLEAEAATATAAVLATQSLQRHGHWADVSLRRVEQGPAAAAPGAGIRFQIAATGLSETAAAPR